MHLVGSLKTWCRKKIPLQQQLHHLEQQIANIQEQALHLQDHRKAEQLTTTYQNIMTKLIQFYKQRAKKHCDGVLNQRVLDMSVARPWVGSRILLSLSLLGFVSPGQEHQEGITRRLSVYSKAQRQSSAHLPLRYIRHCVNPRHPRRLYKPRCQGHRGIYTSDLMVDHLYLYPIHN